MAIREATHDDVALMPLFRGYSDFYESDPDDGDLEKLLQEVIGGSEDEAYCWLPSTTTTRWSASPTTIGSGRAFAVRGSSSWMISSFIPTLAVAAMRTR